MSVTATHDVECDCGAIVTMLVCESLNAERHPHLRAALLERTLHIFQCGACGASLSAENRMLYIDLARRQFYAVAPERRRADERPLSEDLVVAWNVALGEQAPVSVSAMFGSDDFHVRMCFGREEVREKIVLWDAGLADLALEVYKGELLAAHPEWSNAGVRTVRLDHIEPDGRLAFYLERATDPPTALDVGYIGDRTRYEQLARTPWRDLLASHPWVASGPHVSLLRLALPAVAESVARRDTPTDTP